MFMKASLAVLWSLNGPLEKHLLQAVSPDAYAATKALCVSLNYLIMRQTVRFDMLKHPVAWVLVLISTLNTPTYARIVRHENPAVALPFVAAASHLLRLVWMQCYMHWVAHEHSQVITGRQFVGAAFVILGGWLSQG